MKMSNVIETARGGSLPAHARGYLRGLHHRISRHPAGIRVEALLGRTFGRRPTMDRIEMHVTDHCNLNCKGCFHFSSVSPQVFADPEEVARDFARLGELFETIHTVRVMGGEPLLHPRLDEILDSIRRSLPASQILLITNGLLLPKQPSSFWELLAALKVELSISDYPIDIDREAIASACERYSIPCGYTDAIHDFIKVPLVLEGDRDPREMLERCRSVYDCPFVYHGRLFPCAKIALSWILAERFGYEFPVAEADRIDLGSARDGYEVLEMLAHPVPWCRFCAWDDCSDYQWGRTTRDAAEWLSGTSAPDRDGSGQASARTEIV